ncbi:uncharacterized protein LOC100207136 [Hydra vulgaris]|uniref:uncharacterized protein LOC100207136 n=1 Tax=Hydra vulgaris TaxID=6087 RepID=UPI00019243CC|nr:uncharacterized protein LOC100207136 [Hydra vulgaris]
MILALLFVLVVNVLPVQPTCLSVLDGKSCEIIQHAGYMLSREIKMGNIFLNNILLISMENNLKLIESLIPPLKIQLTNIKINNPGITPIEMPTEAIEKNLVKYLVHSALAENKKFLELIVKAASTLVNDYKTSKHLMEYPGIQMTYSGFSLLKSESNNLHDIIKHALPELQSLMTSVDTGLKTSAKTLIDIFIQSIKSLLQDKLQISYEQIESDMLVFSNQSNQLLVKSMLSRGENILQEAVKYIEEIDSQVELLKEDPIKLKLALEPARSLVFEILASTQKTDAYDFIGIKIQIAMNILKTCFSEIKKSLT